MDRLTAFTLNVLAVTVGAVFAALGLGTLHVPGSFLTHVYGCALVLWGICIATLVNTEHR